MGHSQPQQQPSHASSSSRAADWSWLAAGWFLLRYNLSLREVRALLLFVFGPVLGYALVYAPLRIALTRDTVCAGVAVWLLACHVVARGPRSPYVLKPNELRGKTVLITGGNTGIGRELALALVQAGARVVIACRDTAKGEAARQYILRHAHLQRSPLTGGAADDERESRVSVQPLDLSSFASVRALAAHVTSTRMPVHVLLLNAGVMCPPLSRTTRDGFDEQIGVNHLGHMLLTVLLLDTLRACRARVVTLSSSGHAYRSRSRYPTVQSWLHVDPRRTGALDRFWQYCNSKLANVLFTRVVERKLAGSGAHAYVCHPGVAATELTRSMTLFAWLAPAASPFVGKTWTEAAQGALYLATAPDAVPVRLHHDCAPAPVCSDECADDALADALWAESAKCIGVDP